MPEPLPSGSPISAEVHANLRAIARLLREPHRLAPPTQHELALVVEELETALEAGTVPEAEMAHLRDSTAHLAEALRHHHDEGLLAAARGRMHQAVAAAEAQSPFAFGIARRMLDALANLGI